MTQALPSAAGARRRLAVPTLRIGWSEGDVWTVSIGLVLAVTLAVSTIPAVLDARSAAPRTAAPAVDTPIVPADSGAVPGPPADPVALPPTAAATQPLLGPLVPLPPVAAAGEDLPGGGEPAPAAPPPAPVLPAPGEVRLFAALPVGSAPGAVAAGADGSVWAGTDAPAAPGAAAQILTWDVLGVLQGTVQVPDSPAERARGITALTPLPDGSLAAVDAATSRLLRYQPHARSWTELARVPDVAPCLVVTPAPCQPGVLDTAPLLRGVAVDAGGSIFIADAGQGTIWRLTPGSPLEAWYSSADIAGSEGLSGLAIGADGHLRAVVTRLAAVQGTAAGVLLRIDREQDGSAGARTVVAAFQAGEDPVDVALGSSGNSYVALRGADAVVTLDSSGVEQLRVVDDALQDPTALHLAAGRLLVTATSPSPAVLAIGTPDTPLALRPPTAGGPARG